MNFLQPVSDPPVTLTGSSAELDAKKWHLLDLWIFSPPGSKFLQPCVH